MTDGLSQTFQALSDPTRRSLLAQLSKGEMNISELAKPFLKEMSLPAITKHIQVLEKAGLIVKGRDAQFRPCRMRPEPLQEIQDRLEEYRKFWEASFDRLDEYLKTIKKPTKKQRKKRETKK